MSIFDNLSDRQYHSLQFASFVQQFAAHADASLRDTPDSAAQLAASIYGSLAQKHGAAHAIASASQIRLVPGATESSQVARISDPDFWSRYFRLNARRSNEFSSIKAGSVSSHSAHYVSEHSLSAFRSYKKAQREFLQNYRIVDRRLNDSGRHSVRVLADVAKSDSSKKAKLWAFLSGIEQLSVEQNLHCALLTLTLPSSFHAAPSSGRAGFDGVSTPRDGNIRLAQLWNSIQRDLDNEKIAISGARFVEPHKDGTPHWHVWLHYSPAHLPRILSVIARYFPGDASRRVAAVRVREVVADRRGKLHNKKDGSRFTEIFKQFNPDDCTFTERNSRFPAQVDLSIINRAYANGATYASKYAMKTLEPGETSERVAAARWVWGLRGFQLFGIQRCLTLWDELYRATSVPTDPRAAALFDAVHLPPGKHVVQVRNPLTGAVEEVQKEGGTAAFIRALGGLSAGSCVSEERVISRIIYSDGLGKYGDSVRRKLGIMLCTDDGEYLYSTQTREPGRFVLMSVDNLESKLSSLTPYFPSP